MLDVLARNWWALTLRGLAAVLFGVVALLAPGIALGALILLFGAYALVDGVFAIAAAVMGAGRDGRWWALLVEGIVGILAGVAALVWPGLTALALVYVIAAWAIVTGVLEVVAAVRLRREIEGEWLLAIAGVLSVLFGIYVAAFPGAGALAIVWLIGAYALVFGVVMVALSLQLRGRQATRPEQARPPSDLAA